MEQRDVPKINFETISNKPNWRKTTNIFHSKSKNIRKVHISPGPEGLVSELLKRK